MKKRLLSIILTITLLAALLLPAAAQTRKPLLSASSEWTMGSGWMDCSTAEDIIFQNTTDTAGNNFCKNLIDGSKGFRIRFKVDFLDPKLQTTAGIVLRVQSNTLSYFSLRVTGRGDEAMFQADYCDNGVWQTAVPFTANLNGCGGSVIVELAREEKHDTVSFSLYGAQNNLLLQRNASSDAWSGSRFVDCGDLELNIAPYEGYGLFRVSGYSSAAYPDDGIEPPLTASDVWTLGSNWTDDSDSESVAISNSIPNAGPSFFKQHIAAGEGFKLQFDYTGKSNYTTADITLRQTKHNDVYIRTLVTQDNGTALVDVNFFDGSKWTTLGTTGWLASVGKTYHVELAHEAGSDALTLRLTKADGTLAKELRITNSVCTDANFYGASDLEPLVNTCGDYGLFTISDFKVQIPAWAAACWTLEEGWEDVSSFDTPAISNLSETAVPAIWTKTISGIDGTILDFDFAAQKGQKTTAELVLRLASDHNRYLRMRITSQADGSVLVATDYYQSEWTSIDSSVYPADCGGAFHVQLSHQSGSELMTLTLTDVDGTQLLQKQLSNAAVSDKGFWSASYLQALFAPVSGGGRFVISGFAVKSYPAEETSSPDWRLGDGWGVYENDDGIYLSKNDSTQTEAVYTRPINGSKGFKVSFDLSFHSQETSSCCIKLRLPTQQEKYLFARVKGDHNQTLLEAQSYDAAAQQQWSSSLLSAAAGRWTKNNGTVSVSLERQAMSGSIRFAVTDKLSGELLLEETITSKVLSAADFLDYNGLEWIFGTDSGSPGYRVMNFCTQTYPADPVALTSISIEGPQVAEVGETLRFTASYLPQTATVKSIEWLLDGVHVGSGNALSYRFPEAGSYSVSIKMTDYSSNTLEKVHTVQVTAARVNGDLNADGAVNREDAQLLSDAIVGLTTLTPEQAALADMNEDGALDSEDTYRMLTAVQTEKRSTDKNTVLPEPTQTDYRFNGHWVTERAAFELALDDWRLATFTDSAAQIVAGTVGAGITYNKALGEKWYGCISICMDSEDTAGLVFDEDCSVLIKTVAGSGTLVLRMGEQELLSESIGTLGASVKLLFDSTDEGLRLYVWNDGAYSGGWQTQAQLKNNSTIGFTAQKNGDTFTDFGVNHMIYQYADNPTAALAQVEAWAKQEVEGSIVQADNGVNMYTPDGVKNYDALWTRDFTYMLEYAGDYIPLADAVDCIEYLLENVRKGDCWLPDRVYGNGKVNYAAGEMDGSKANLDNNAFIVIAMDCALERSEEAAGKELFLKWQDTLMTALDSLPKDENGLVYNDTLNPHSPYGFTDCVCKTGSLMKESLLLWRAYSIMVKWQEAYGLSSAVASAGAANIEQALVSTFANADGMLNAATIDCCQSDVWGSCYAVSIGFPLEDSLKKSISDYLAENYCGLVQMGQLRHTAPGTYWDKLLSGVTPGEYQNGAYWATPTGWLIDALEPYHTDLAQETLQDVISYFAAEGIYECINGEYRKLNHYAASISNVLPAARRLLNVAAELESVTVNGATKAVVGAEKTYTATLTPADAKLVSCVWKLDGAAVSNKQTLSYRFTAAGEYTLSCEVTDTCSNVRTGSLTVSVTEPDYAEVTMTVAPIIGTAGQSVEASYTLSEASMLVSGDWQLAYDAALLEPEQYRAGDAWSGVFAANKTQEGIVRLTMAAKEPLREQAVLFTVRYRLKQDVCAVYALAQVLKAASNQEDDSGLHTPEITVVKAEPVSFTVTWIVDGLQSTESYTAGELPTFKGSTDKPDDQLFVYTFLGWDEAPAAVTKDAVYTARYAKTIRSITPDNRFTDVQKGKWFYADAYTAAGLGLFSGTSSTTFAPEKPMTRAMLVSVLWRLEGSPAPEGTNPFADIKNDAWYTQAVIWAAENKIVSGTGKGFEPDGNVTREQIAVMVCNYTKWKQLDTSKTADLSGFPDERSVAGWAREALSWANAEGLVSGAIMNNITLLQPQGKATRAQVASLLVRYVSNILASN